MNAFGRTSLTPSAFGTSGTDARREAGRQAGAVLPDSSQALNLVEGIALGLSRPAEDSH